MGLWDSVTGFFSDLGDFFSGKDFFEAAGYAWNDMMKLAADVLTKNPSSGTYKDVWENISTIYTTLNVVAVSLLCIFFLYGFCRDSCDLHADLTFERTIKMFIRLIITSNVMSMALSYMPKFFAWGKNLTSAILGENKLSMIYDFDGVKVYLESMIWMVWMWHLQSIMDYLPYSIVDRKAVVLQSVIPRAPRAK